MKNIFLKIVCISFAINSFSQIKHGLRDELGNAKASQPISSVNSEEIESLKLELQ